MATPAKAAAEHAEPEEAPAAAAPAKKRGVLLPLIGSALMAAALASGSTWFLAHNSTKQAKTTAADAGADGDKSDAPAAPQPPAIYLELTPAFVVNLADDEAMRFLQVEVQIMARDPKVIDAAKDHMPRIRNALLMLFGQQHFHDLESRESKEGLQKKALDEVQKALEVENAPSQVEAVYFTSFVMQ